MNKKIKKITGAFSAKVTIMVCITMLVCSLIWTTVMFLNMRNSAINNMVNEEWSFIEKTQKNINNIEEICNMSTHIVSQMDNVINYLRLVQSGADYGTRDKIDFYNNDIASIYNITNLNPYLCQIRLFVDSDRITEKKPCLYLKKRMYNLEWANSRKDGQWNIDYEDSVFPDSIGSDRLAGITTTLYNSKGEELCVLEVATSMSMLFPEMYSNDKDSWACFISDTNEVHYDEKMYKEGTDFSEIIKLVKKSKNNNTVYTTKILNENVVVSTTRIDSFSGTYVHIRKSGNSILSYYNGQKLYIYVVLVSIFVCMFLTTLLTKNMFRRFNLITDGITKIKKGQTDLRLDVSGEDDEISQMAEQINQMLDTLKELNEENTTRQLIVKNTEIKAMQNQINAHFMYNVLETIKMMAEINEQFDISDAVTSLGQMFRYSVKWTSGKVALKEELKYICNYLALMDLRLECKIILSIDVPDELMYHKIPKMALQPIVENSVLHGLEGYEEKANIYVNAYVKDEILHIEVSDNGKGMTQEELNRLKDKLKGEIKLDEATIHGLALKNVQNRIKMYYGDDYGLEVYSKEGKYTKVVILMPYDKGEIQKDG